MAIIPSEGIVGSEQECNYEQCTRYLESNQGN